MRVAVLGCGYVGLALGRQLAGDHEVVGVRRSEAGLEAVRAAGLTAVEADVTVPETLDAVPAVDAVVFAASSGGRDVAAAREVYVEGQRRAIEHFGARADPPERYVYTSSTGVYGDHDGDWVDETTPLDPQTDRAAALVEAERVALEGASAAGMEPTVARLAGLYGPDRYRLERYLTGPVTAGYLNLVHREDAAGAIAHFLETGAAGGDVVLVVDDEPVDRRVLADWLADACGEPAPPTRTVAEARSDADRSAAASRRLRADKRCDNGYLRSLGYELRYPTFRAGYRAAVEAYREGH